MPRGDGTGPMGQGAATGRGFGRSQGAGTGRMGGAGLGTGGNCICPRCGQRVSHQRGVPCTQLKCPACGTLMARES